MEDGGNKSSVPTVSSKSIKKQELRWGEKADTGGDMLDRASGNYSKNPPVREDDPFSPFDNY